MTQETFDKSGAWGMSASADLRNCARFVTNTTAIRAFVLDLCHDIGMRRFGPCELVYFGDDEKIAGYSMTQLIETSLVSGHFVDATNDAYIDVFSCRYFDVNVFREVAERWFYPSSITTHVQLRGVA